jgi:preprotein translocase subunit SecD
MNRYPLWKYAILLVAVIVGLVYTLPNFFGEAPAVQVSSGKVTVRMDEAMTERVRQALADANVPVDFVQFDGNSVRARFADTDTQIRARDVIDRALNPDAADPSYVVALNLVSRSPQWLASLGAMPMYLGLDLRGGVHFLMQVDMGAALSRRSEAYVGDARALLRDRNIRHAGVTRVGDNVEVRFREAALQQQAADLLREQLTDMDWVASADGVDFKLTGTFQPEAARRIQDQALKQNITTLHNRINELGTSEPVIQQQGLDRVVVQLPGVQDTARAKDIIGRTATLEVRLVDDSAEAQAALAGSAPVPARSSSPARTSPTPRRVSTTSSSRRCTSRWTRRARASSATSRARTSGAAWPSCCSRRARARW